ncbi:MAG: adenylyl-sulfate reductase subunit alpha [Desulfobacterota bacterium]|nr:adenylyl-sulfate reductase subunit alpha [Thermodesulfobacteriota bacterium]
MAHFEKKFQIDLPWPVRRIRADLVIIGGGAAGCAAAIFAKHRRPELSVLVLEKAHISRSGCLAMGLNAINAYLGESSPQDYLAYVKRDNYGICRDDLVLSIGERLNRMVAFIEGLGVPFPRDSNGRYCKRSPRSIIMLGEHIKPLLARAVLKSGATVLNRTPAVRLLTGDNGARVCGVVGFNMRSHEIVVIHAGAIIVATGGASGIYRPSNPGLARTKTWYCPYNAGSGLAMGIRAGAEVTSFEMRFVALRTKDVIAPTGTLALNMKLPHRNARGEPYLLLKEQILGRRLTTAERLLFTLEEHQRGAGPCYIDLSSLDKEGYRRLIENYLNMAPSIVLDLLQDPAHPKTRIEICGSEPYINGGHGMAGFLVDTGRRSNLAGLYAIGDAAGGAPKKYVSGCCAEADIAVTSFLQDYSMGDTLVSCDAASESLAIQQTLKPLMNSSELTFTDIEDRLQKIMEEYAGGSTQNYECSGDKLLFARSSLETLAEHAEEVGAVDGHTLSRAHDALDRVLLARVLVEHLLARCETRWPCYQSRVDFPVSNDLEYRLFINSCMRNGRISLIKRDVTPPYQIKEGQI